MVGVCTSSSQQEFSKSQRELGTLHFQHTSQNLALIHQITSQSARNVSGGNHRTQRKCGDFCVDITQTSWLARTQRFTAESNIEKLLADRKQGLCHLSKQHDPAFVCRVGAGFGTLTPSCHRGRQGGHLAPGSAAAAVWVCRAEDATMSQPSKQPGFPPLQGAPPPWRPSIGAAARALHPRPPQAAQGHQAPRRPPVPEGPHTQACSAGQRQGPPSRGQARVAFPRRAAALQAPRLCVRTKCGASLPRTKARCSLERSAAGVGTRLRGHRGGERVVPTAVATTE